MVRITINGYCVQFSSEVAVKPELWDTQARRASGNSEEANKVNEKLKDIKMTLEIYCREKEWYESFVSAKLIRDAFVRVPIIISGTALPYEWKGKEDARPAELVDVYPTLLKAAGIEVTEKAVGISLLDKNETREASFCALHERKTKASFMVRTEKYKLILCFARKEDASTYTKADITVGEFYDLKADPKEWNNLYESEEIEQEKTEMTEVMMAKLSTMSCLVPNIKSEKHFELTRDI